MLLLRAYRALGPVDVHSIRRDSLLRWIIFLPALIALGMRFGIPLLSQLLSERIQFDLHLYYPLINSFLYLVMPMIVGMVLGFLLLDQRDDRTLTALQVTPLSLNGYLAYRISLPMVLSVVMTLLMVPIAGIGQVSLPAHLAATLVAAPLAPMFAIFNASLAQNKVQGFAVIKASSIISMPPMIAYFFPGDFQWLTGLVPTYWPMKVYWLLADSNSLGWLAALVGLIYMAGVMIGLLRWFNRVMHSGTA